MFVQMLSDIGYSKLTRAITTETKLRIERQLMLGKKIVEGLVYVTPRDRGDTVGYSRWQLGINIICTTTGQKSGLTEQRRRYWRSAH